MFGLGLGEMLIIGLVALIAVGPKKMPGLAKAVGRGISEFRNAMDDMKTTVYREVQQPMQQAMDQKQEIRETSSDYLDRLLAQREKERAETEAKANEIYAEAEVIADAAATEGVGEVASPVGGAEAPSTVETASMAEASGSARTAENTVGQGDGGKVPGAGGTPS